MNVLEPTTSLKMFEPNLQPVHKKNVKNRDQKSSTPRYTLAKREPLSTKKVLEFLLAGKLRTKVCRYCLHITSPLSEFDQILRIAGKDAMYEITIRDIVASFHPFKVVDDENFPNKICEKCLNQALKCYLFVQQCEQSERALRDCFNDIFEKFEKLDPLEQVKKRGRHKNKVNHNVLYPEHPYVIDYAEPIRHLRNSGTVTYSNEPIMSDLECKKCWQVLPNIESLANHEKSHPKSMWYNCRVCGHSSPKTYLFKRHLRTHLKMPRVSAQVPRENDERFECKQCGAIGDNYMTHLQHVEKHKFQKVLECVVEKQMNKLCAVCLEEGNLTNLDKTICLHGGYPELTGDRPLYSILGSSIPEMNILHNYTGSKICEKCLNNAIKAYVFINRTKFIRSRLDTCISRMIENINNNVVGENNVGKKTNVTTENNVDTGNNVDTKSKVTTEHNVNTENIVDIKNNVDTKNSIDTKNYIETKNNVDIGNKKLFIEITINGIMPVIDYDDINDLILEENEINESELKVDILEDEFREPESESESSDSDKAESDKDIDLDLKPNLPNGYRPYKRVKDVCSEFLTFKKKLKRNKHFRYKLTCSACNKKFISEYFLKKHLNKHKNQRTECRLCNKQFISKFSLNEHTRAEHVLKISVYNQCDLCHRVFIEKQKFSKHKKSHIQKTCELCCKVFANQKYFDAHLQRHASKFGIFKQKSNHSCSFCEEVYLNENELLTHVNKVHLQIRPFACDMCDRKFYTDNNLAHHRKIHVMPKKETCKLCSKTLKCRKDLVVHVRKHLGMKTSKCLVCSEGFYSDSKVKKHMKIWHGGCFCCKLCKKVFLNKSGLKNHINVAHSVF